MKQYKQSFHTPNLPGTVRVLHSKATAANAALTLDAPEAFVKCIIFKIPRNLQKTKNRANSNRDQNAY